MTAKRAIFAAIVFSTAVMLGACTAREIGQTLYNTAKAYCEDSDTRCGGSGTN